MKIAKAVFFVTLSLTLASFVTYPKNTPDLLTPTADSAACNDLQSFSTSFNGPLKQWASSFNNFNLSGFCRGKTEAFEHVIQQDFAQYKEFLSVYKPLLNYSRDGSWFVDIHSALNLQKKGDHYEANPDIDQPVWLCNPTTKYWERIYFGTPHEWIDEVVWVADNKFILVGSQSTDGGKKRIPVVLVGDTKTHIFTRYMMQNANCVQKESRYQSPTLKKIKIIGG
jgi:hypothetical protein